MAEEALRELMLKWEGELSSSDPDLFGSELFRAERDANGRAGEKEANVASLDYLRYQLKQQQFRYLATQIKLLLAQGCQLRDHTSFNSLPAVGKELCRARQEAKQKLKEQERDSERSQVDLAALYSAVHDSFSAWMRLNHECVQGVQEVQRAIDSAAAHGDPISASIGLELVINDIKHAEDAVKPNGAQLADLLKLKDEETLKRRRLEDEAKSLRETLQEVEAMKQNAEKLEAELKSEVDLQEAIANHCKELHLGLPRIDFDDVRGAVVLNPSDGRPMGICDDAEIRTIMIEFDENGHLVKAEAHPSLQLWEEATTSVENNDLARLVTLVWDKICQSSRVGPTAACFESGSCGGS